MSFNELLGHRLREIRKRKELTQETVAEWCATRQEDNEK